MKDFFAKLKYLFRWRDVAFAVVLLSLTMTLAFCKSSNMMDVTYGDEALDVQELVHCRDSLYFLPV
jgi:hypothetical protein